MVLSINTHTAEKPSFSFFHSWQCRNVDSHFFCAVGSTAAHSGFDLWHTELQTSPVSLGVSARSFVAPRYLVSVQLERLLATLNFACGLRVPGPTVHTNIFDKVPGSGRGPVWQLLVEQPRGTLQVLLAHPGA